MDLATGLVTDEFNTCDDAAWYLCRSRSSPRMAATRDDDHTILLYDDCKYGNNEAQSSLKKLKQ